MVPLGTMCGHERVPSLVPRETSQEYPTAGSLQPVYRCRDNDLCEDWATARKRGMVWYLVLRGEGGGKGALMNGPSPVAEVFALSLCFGLFGAHQFAEPGISDSPSPKLR